MSSASLAPVLTPHGHLILGPEPDAPPITEEQSQRIEKSFARGSGHGLLQLGAGEVGSALPPLLAWWREFGSRYVTAVCASQDAVERPIAAEALNQQIADAADCLAESALRHLSRNRSRRGAAVAGSGIRSPSNA